MKLLVHLVVKTIALLATAAIVPGFVIVNLTTAILAAIVISVINLVIRPIMLLITLPINILTLGLFTFVINGLMLWLAASFIDGFTISGPLAAILGGIVIAVVGSILGSLLGDDSN